MRAHKKPVHSFQLVDESLGISESLGDYAISSRARFFDWPMRDVPAAEVFPGPRAAFRLSRYELAKIFERYGRVAPATKLLWRKAVLGLHCNMSSEILPRINTRRRNDSFTNACDRST
jgi:hypothetical protein